ncbi:MAG: hypothetical protein KY445_06060 [Armatimonadetes bacterium]|nr:hypothetical protein [Armatimonadota bacterium]
MKTTPLFFIQATPRVLIAIGAMVALLSAPVMAQSSLTLSGIVTGRMSDEVFLLRAYDLTHRVQAPRGTTLRVGDRVRAYGSWKNGRLQARNLRVLRRAILSAAPSRSVTGAVVRDLPGEEFRVRARNGSLYRVLALRGEPKSLTYSDTVRAYGVERNGVLHATRVDVLYEGKLISNKSAYRPRRIVSGVVTADLSGNRFRMRARNGRVYDAVALWGEPAALSAGDRVRAYGYLEDGTLHASNLRVLRGNRNPSAGTGRARIAALPRPYGANFGPRTLNGVVTALSGARLTLRASNGIEYPVRIVTGRPGGLTLGDTVRASGGWAAGTMRASRLRILKHG